MGSVRVATPPMAWQPSLLAAGSPQPDLRFSDADRHELADGAWVDVVPRWLHGADALFDDLVATVAWQAHEVPMYERVVAQPRLSRWWGQGRRSSWPSAVGPLADALSSRYDVVFDALGINLYRDGRDSVAWHGDREYRDQPEAMVAVLSLGSPRRFLLRPTGGGPSRRFDLCSGDLLVMGGTCQHSWQHAVPKVAAAGPRISVTLRHRRPLGGGSEGRSAGRVGGRARDQPSAPVARSSAMRSSS